MAMQDRQHHHLPLNAAEMTTRAASSIAWGAWALLAASTVMGATHVGEFVYTSPGSTDPMLDVWVSDEGLLPGAPTVLYIHGGGWYSGDKATDVGIFAPIADAGYSVVACNYTLSSDVSPSFPQVAHDVKAVVRWIRTEGIDLGLSPTIIVSGPSAGGHLTEFLGATADIAEFEPLPAPTQGYAVQACLPMFGLCDFVQQVNTGGDTSPFAQLLGGPLNGDTLATYVAASPITWVTADDAPMRHLHGTDDPIHDVEQAYLMHAALEDVGVYSVLDIFDGGHAFSDYTYDGLVGFSAYAEAVVQESPVLLASGRTADIDLDGNAGVNDVLAMLAQWGDCPELPIDCAADIDGSGDVGVDDLLELLDGWGS
ncbi:MAG: alpha/beta hydrolase [Phycisphaerales bacterium]|nr:alpha/beta hydrolase [Phycisphaerales bacterium]